MSVDTLNTNARFNKFIAEAHFFVSQKEFGAATDIIRYLALYIFGGVYLDGDGILAKSNALHLPVEKIMAQTHAFVGQERHFDYRVGNAFIAAEKESQLIKAVLDNVERNLFDMPHAPDYVKYSCGSEQRTLVWTGPVQLTVACAKVGDECTVLPYGYIYTVHDGPGGKQSQESLLTKGFSPCIDDSALCKVVGRIADHDFAASWIVAKEKFDYTC